MRALKRIITLIILGVLVVFMTKVVLIKKQTLQVKPFSEKTEEFRSFEIDEKAILEFQNREKDNWLNVFTANYLYQNMRMNSKDYVGKYSLYYGMLSKKRVNEYSTQINKILSDMVYFPVPQDGSGGQSVGYENSWMQGRNYGGSRKHEGCDIIPSLDEPGYFPVQSVCDGTVEKMGWLNLGGYRVGIRSANGNFFYYAHLSSYASGLKVGDAVKAGQTIGMMGDTGYGPEGTSGQFVVHLHFGIYMPLNGEDVSINPYHALKYIEKNRKTFYQNGE